MLQNVNATFEWVRLAQRIPVRIKLINVPKDTIFSSGMTVTVSIIEGTSSTKERMAGININLWTLSKFLSERPIKDAMHA